MSQTTNGNPVRSRRIALLLEVGALAAAAGVSRDTVTRAERGERISELSQERLARALETTRDALFPA